MVETSDVEQAERIGRSRARWLAAQAALFAIWQALFFFTSEDQAVRSVDQVRTVAWLVWVLALLLLLGTGGGLMRNAAVRALLDDELTRANRSAALVCGFWAAAAAAILLYLVDLFEPVAGAVAIHIMLSATIGTALVAFGFGEMRGRAEG